MAQISGNAKRYDGRPIDYVHIFDWATGDCMGNVVPNEQGDWSYVYRKNINIGVSYISDGCEPQVHGAYFFEVSMPEDTVLHYSLNGNTNDLSVNGLNGLIEGSVGFVAGRKAGVMCAKFNGGLIKTAIPIPGLTRVATVSFWVNIIDTVTPQFVYVIGSVSQNQFSTLIAQNSEKQTFEVVNKSGNYGGSRKAAYPLGWHHIVVEIDRDQTAVEEKTVVYINNAMAETSVRQSQLVTSSLAFTYLTIGANTVDGADRFNGELQDIRVYNRILTEAERTLLFNE